MQDQAISRPCWYGKRVLVTGGTAFIGSHLVERLVAQGGKVRVASIEGIGDVAHLQDSIELVKRDLTEEVDDLVEGIDYLFHLAAITDLNQCRSDPFMALKVNTYATLNLLESARRNGVKKFLYMSTLGVYGVARHLPQNEMDYAAPLEPYAASKLSAEHFVLVYPTTYGVSTSVARCFNAYGPRQKENMVIPSIITQIIRNGTVEIGNLDSTRDFVYVDDVVTGLLRIIEMGKHDIYNIGTGRETSIRSLVSVIAGIMGKKIDVRPAENRKRKTKIDVPRSQADTTRMKRDLRWEAGVQLEKGLARTIDFYCNRPK